MLKDLKELVTKYPNYEILAEDADTLYFNIRINNVTDDVLKNYKLYEIDNINKVIYLESIPIESNILIVSNDELELPYTVVKNLNEAAKFMNVEATHLYRAWRNAERSNRLEYKDYILIKI